MRHSRRVLDPELVARVADASGLTRGEAARVIGDVLAHYAEPVEVYVRRRHHELQTYGMRNAEAFRTIGAELRSRLVAAPDMSERQLRRLIYG